MTPKLSTNNYERTPRAPLTNHQKLQVQPTTPITSCKVTVTSIYHIPKHEQKILEHGDTQKTQINTIYRAHRVHIEPTIDFPPPPSDIDDYEDMNTQRPSHNLLSNIVPSIPTTPSIDQSSQQSTKHIASSFGFDTSIEPRHINDTINYSNTDTSAQNDEQIELESISSNDEDNDYVDYLCKSTSTLGISSPGAQTFYA
jgi:hypothetical protein